MCVRVYVCDEFFFYRGRFFVISFSPFIMSIFAPPQKKKNHLNLGGWVFFSITTHVANEHFYLGEGCLNEIGGFLHHLLSVFNVNNQLKVKFVLGVKMNLGLNEKLCACMCVRFVFCVCECA